jgi:hypothetical protein
MKTLKRLNSNWATRKYHVLVFSKMILCTVLLTLYMATFAQSTKLETGQGLNEAVAAFDADIRQAILVASQYPAVLTQLQKSQDETMRAFQDMINGFGQQKQEWFYTVTRYPEFMHQLATLPKGESHEAINKLLPHQDPDLEQAAWKLYRWEKKNLARLDNIRINAHSGFEKSIASLNANGRNAFHKLQARPDVLTLLTNNIDLTTKLGQQYRNNPGSITNQLAVLHDKQEIQNEREAAALKKQLESDPKAMKELRQASSAYGYGYNGYYNNPYYYPYSYWFGYPYWYSYPAWYPGLYWYTPGFYFGTGGLYGYPSYGFLIWFYNQGHCMNYPHLYRGFRTYYEHNTSARVAVAPVGRGFASVATRHYEPTRVRTNAGLSPLSYRQQNTIQHQVRGNFNNNFNGNLNSINRVQPWGGGNRRTGIINGGSVGGGLRGRGRH